MKINPKSIYHPKNLDMNYYNRQAKKTYESTKIFFKFLNDNIKLKNKKIIDMGCANCSNLIYLKKNYEVSDCLGVDQNKKLLKLAKRLIKNSKLNGIDLNINNINKLSISKNKLAKYDGAICLQTLSVLDDYKEVVKSIKNLDFFGVNSLFWDGLIDFKIKVNFLKKNSQLRTIEKINDYNIYSLPKYVSYMRKNGFKINHIKKLPITKKIKNKEKSTMGTYTTKINGEKKFVSGPIILDWYLIISKKK